LNIGIFAGHGTGFGDTIRVRKIKEFLCEKGYGVVNLEETLGANNFRASANPKFAYPFRRVRPFLATIPFLNYINLLRLSKALEKKIHQEKIDVLQCETTIPAYIGSLALKQSKIPLVFDMHGLSAEQALMERKPHSLVRFIQRIQIETLRSSDHILAVSDLHKEYLKSVIPAQKITIVPNAGDVRSYFPKSDQEVNVIFGGIFSYWENIPTYIKSSVLNRNNQIKFYLAGDGPMRETLTNLLRRYNAPVQYLGKLPRDEAMSFFDKCHIGIFTSTSDIARRVACPIKFFDYMSCGLAIVCEDIGWWPQLVQKYGVGRVVKQNSPAELYESISRLAFDTQERKRMGQNGRKLICEEFNWRKQLSKMERVYNRIVRV
jgi:glycosyltransferase involved in cell wall biosynthesis